MRVIVPIKLKDEDIVSYSVKPDPYSVWQNSVAYRRGRRVIVYDGVNKIYESLYPNVDRYPPDNTQQEQPAWLLVGPVNLWSMLNPVPDQRTRGMNEIYVEVSPTSPVTAVGAHGLEGTSIRVQVFSATGTTLADRTTALTYESTIGSGLYSEAVFSQLPWASGARIKVTVSNPGKLAICESLVFGEYKTIGATQPLAAVNVIDPSEKVFDTFGRAYAKRRDQKKGVTATVVVPRDSIDYCQSILANLRATPTTWVTEETIPLSIVYGMYRDFEISLDSPRHGTCRLEVGPIIYEPTVPPVKPLGDSVFWTSRPYSYIAIPENLSADLPTIDSTTLSVYVEDPGQDYDLPEMIYAPGPVVESAYLSIGRLDQEVVELLAPSVSLPFADLRPPVAQYPGTFSDPEMVPQLGAAVTLVSGVLRTANITYTYDGEVGLFEALAPSVSIVASDMRVALVQATAGENLAPSVTLTGAELRQLLKLYVNEVEALGPNVSLTDANLRLLLKGYTNEVEALGPSATLEDAQLSMVLRTYQDTELNAVTANVTITGATLE